MTVEGAELEQSSLVRHNAKHSTLVLKLAAGPANLAADALSRRIGHLWACMAF
jgi:hypothetical protein